MQQLGQAADEVGGDHPLRVDERLEVDAVDAVRVRAARLVTPRALSAG